MTNPVSLTAATNDDIMANASIRSPSSRKFRVLILFSDTGGGHRASAQALSAALHQLYPSHVQVDMLDFFVDITRGPFANFPAQYAYMAKHPWMWNLTYHFAKTPPGRFSTELALSMLGAGRIRNVFKQYAPDLILSVHPLVNTVSLRVLNRLNPGTPFVTVVTDLAGAHPTWFNKRADMIYVPIDECAKLALDSGVPRNRITIHGLPVRKDFWSPARPQEELREELGIMMDVPAVLLIGGGDGVGGLKAITEHVVNALHEASDTPAQLVVICGKNAQLCEYLSTKSWPVPLIAKGYVNNMSDWMAACDIICTKAGPGTIAEALIRKLPIVVTAFLPGQEEANVKFVESQGVGVFADKPKDIASVVISWLSNPTLLKTMSERAGLLGRPAATMDIAKDMIKVTRAKIEENLQRLQRQRQMRADRANSQQLLESSSQSHLVFRLRFLLRVVFGSMLLRKVVANAERRSSLRETE